MFYSSKHQEYAIQFVGQDALPAETVAFLYHLVDASIVKPEPLTQLKGFYMPTYEQSRLDPRALQTLQQADISLASPLRWESPGDAVYAFGWAMGRLTYVHADQIDQAYRDGELKATDILLTDAVLCGGSTRRRLDYIQPDHPCPLCGHPFPKLRNPFHHESYPVTQAELQQSVGVPSCFAQPRAGASTDRHQQRFTFPCWKTRSPRP